MPNNGVSSCTINEDCYDSTYGQCINGTCACNPGYVSSSGWCYFPSPASYPNTGASCSSSSQCTDNVNGYCISNRCLCRMGTYWQAAAKKCLILNDGMFSCQSIADCVDQVSGVCTGVCLCKSGYEWSRLRNKCGKANTGGNTCTSTFDCLDVVNGDCIAGFCGCVKGVWNPFNQECTSTNLKANSGTLNCQNITECIDGVNGECSAVCKCKVGFSYNAKYSRCGKPNDQIQRCSANYDCLDMINGMCLNGKCVCKTGSSLTDTGDCGYLNDGRNVCSADSDCYIYSSPGTCKNYLCTCVTGYVWDGESLRCTNLKPNNGTMTCLSSIECADRIFGECSPAGKCECKSGYSWVGYNFSCKKPNDRTFSCISRKECVDSTLGECLMGYCACSPGSVWIPSQHRCLRCPAGCSTCTGPETCGDCLPRYVRSGNSSLCVRCDSRCIKCTGTDNKHCQNCDVLIPGVHFVAPSFCICAGTYVYNSQTAQGVCELCSPGSFLDPAVEIGCQLCPAGYYQDQKGQLNCIPCPPGSYSSKIGSIECVLCPAHTNQTSFGQSTCVQCPLNYLNNIVECLPCHPFCARCTGLSNHECVAGACAAFAYPIAGDETTCLQMCTTAQENLYLNVSTGKCEGKCQMLIYSV